LCLAAGGWFREPGGTDPVNPGLSGGGGDFDGDGFDDLVIGDPDNDAGQTLRGKTFLRYGRQFGKGVVINGAAADGFGDSVKSAGDFNNDGFPDIVVGAPQADPSGVTDAGQAYIFYGTALGPKFTGNPQLTADVILTSPAPLTDEFMGSSVAGIGDYDGDGFDDVVLGAPGAYGGNGTIYVFFGARKGFAAVTKLANIGNTVTELGFDVAGGCDIDGNGFPDIVTGSTKNNQDTYVFFSYGPGLQERDVNIGNSVHETVGGMVFSVAMYPDPSGNDYIILGGTAGGSTFASLYSYNGGTGTLDVEADFDVISNTMAENRNITVVPSLDSDPLPDVVIGAPGTGIGIYYGETLPANRTAFETRDALISETVLGNFGYSVSSAGDLNNDGYDDILVGSHTNNQAFIFYGSNIRMTDTTRAAEVDITITYTGVLGTAVCGGFDLNRDGAFDILMSGAGSVRLIPGRLGMTPGNND
jgi:hypothetical protein